ncbi:MAG: hypothetical protein V2I43_15755 [Parvularcula sp.]|jgi:hypothetical protein|nr:hypothetical protein [Parvularcula sp.]
MFDHIETYTAMPSATHDLRAFVHENLDALLNAAALLGGRPGLRLAQAVSDGLRDVGAPSRRTMEALDDLLDLLMLEHVHDTDRIEAGRFVLIDPASPIVEEICLLADGLDDALDAYRAAPHIQSSAVWQEAAA